MDVTKYMDGHYVEIALEKIKDYDKFSLYQVYRISKNSKRPLYKECFSSQQLAELERSNYRVRVERYE